MALNWKHMKGFWQSSNSASTKYTFINFKDSTKSGEFLLPDIYINDTNLNENIINGSDQSSGTNYGHIVTTKISNIFQNDQYLSQGKSLGWTNGITTVGNIGRDGAKLYIKDNTEIQVSIGSNNYWKLTSAKSYIYNPIVLEATNGSSTSAAEADFYVKGYSRLAKAVYIGSTLTVSSACNADYFNATSDIRAKEEIIPLDFNALDFIKNLNLYSFNYKHSHSPSIGVIAQEIKDIDIQGFSLVDNKEASGEDNDYMSVKESKLIYILCKAVKELEAEVESLKQQLNYGK